MKIAIIGGGSYFTLSIMHGLTEIMQKGSFFLEIFLYDTNTEKSAAMAEYIKFSADQLHLPVKAYSTDLNRTLQNAEIVILAAGFKIAEKKAAEAAEQFGFNPHSIHDGAPSLTTAAIISQWFTEISLKIKKRCADALVLNLINPTDILANFMLHRHGLNCAGLCVELEELKGILAYHFNENAGELSLTYGGTNHDGWILSMRKNDKDVYNDYREKIQTLTAKNDFHPSLYGFLKIAELTGYLRTSGFHYWTYRFENPYDQPEYWQKFSRQISRDEIFKKALQEKKPIPVNRAEHPLLAPVPFPDFGIEIARIIRAVITGETAIECMQVSNKKSIPNLPKDAFVEIPVKIKRKKLIATKPGPLPPNIHNLTSLLAFQKAEFTKYLVSRKTRFLKNAISCMPDLSTTENLIKYTEFLKNI